MYEIHKNLKDDSLGVSIDVIKFGYKKFKLTYLLLDNEVIILLLESYYKCSYFTQILL